MWLGTWNVQTLSGALKLEEVCREMNKYDLDILGLAEIRWIGDGDIQTTTGYRFLYSGNSSSNKMYGVGILVKPAAAKSYLGHQAISERIITVRFKTDKGNLTMIQCYAPTNVTEYEKKDEFYHLLRRTLNSAPKDDIIIVAGDFNAKVGVDNTGFEHIMGKHGVVDNVTDNGNRMINLAEQYKLFIGGTYFRHTIGEKYTYIQKRGRSKQQIDHILISRKHLNLLADVRNEQQADIYSDHLLLVAELELQPSSMDTFDLTALKDEQIVSDYRRKVREALAAKQNKLTWATIGEILRQVAYETLGKQQSREQTWLSERTWKQIEKRQKLKTALENARSEDERLKKTKQYNAVQNEIKECAKNDEIMYNVIQALAITEQVIAAQRKDYRTQCCAYKKLTDAQSHLTPVKKSHVGLPGSNERQIERRKIEVSGELDKAIADQKRETQKQTPTKAESAMRMHIKLESTLLDHEVAATSSNNRGNALINVSPPTVKELELAIKTIETPNNVDIPIELLQHALEELLPFLVTIFSEIWSARKLPMIAPNVTHIPAFQHILAAILYQRIAPTLHSLLRVEQRGYGSKANCIDNIATIRQIIEKSIAYKTPLLLLFLNFEAPYETIRRNVIWKRLRFLGIPEALVTFIAALYAHSASTVGLYENCKLSRLLYAIVLDGVLGSTKLHVGEGIELKPGYMLGDLEYGENICLLASTTRGMKSKLAVLLELAGNVGLRLDLQKTKVMQVNIFDMQEMGQIVVGGEIHQIADIEQQRYLGCLLTKNGNADADAGERIDLARCKFKEWQAVWKCGDVGQNEKIEIFNKIIKPVLFYGSETWVLTRKSLRRLDYFMVESVRTICNKPPSTTREVLSKLANWLPVGKELAKQRSEWLATINSRDEKDIVRMALQWQPKEKDKRRERLAISKTKTKSAV